MKKRERPALVRLILDNRRYWPGMIGLVVLMLLSGLLKSIAATFLGRAVDAGTAGQLEMVLRDSLVVMAAFLMDGVRLAAFNIQTARVIETMFLEIKTHMFQRIPKVQLAAFEGVTQAGDAVSRVTQDLNALKRLVAETGTWLISVFGRGLIALIFCLTISWKLSLVYILLLPLSVLLMDKIGKSVQALTQKASRESGKAYSVMTEMMNNHAVVKAFGAEQEMSKRFARSVDSQREHNDASEKRGMWLSLLTYAADILQIALVFILGVYLIAQGEMTIGALISFIALSAHIRDALNLAEKSILTVRNGNALAARLYEMLDLPLEAGSRVVGATVAGDTLVDIKQLSYSYGAQADVVQDICLKLKQGQRIALVGPSGCGKTTIAKLICKFYDNYRGTMNAFGVPVRSLEPDSLRSHIAMVTQDAGLFPGTIAENVRHGRLDATDSEIEDALRAVQLWDFVSLLDEGVYTEIGDYGCRLSGGQRQRLAIARALIRDADIVILDEATSALDTQTELELQRMLETLFKNKAVLVIAHRYAALRGVDWVYCMEHGRIIEQGAMADLLARDGYLGQMAAASGGRSARSGVFRMPKMEQRG